MEVSCGDSFGDSFPKWGQFWGRFLGMQSYSIFQYFNTCGHLLVGFDLKVDGTVEPVTYWV